MKLSIEVDVDEKGIPQTVSFPVCDDKRGIVTLEMVIAPLLIDRVEIERNSNSELATLINTRKENCLQSIIDCASDELKATREKRGVYDFKSADVVESNVGLKRIIVKINRQLQAFDILGFPVAAGQKEFELYGYKKIGTLGDFLK